jgi:pimeloyl-ACP methyl ester carboxylesterase
MASTRFRKVTILTTFLCGVITVAMANDGRLERTNLLMFHRAGQAVQGRTIADWKKRRTEIIKGMESIMGPLPGKEKRCRLNTQTEEETDCGTFVRRRITYQSEPGSIVSAYLLIPKDVLAGKRKAHAVLCLHPTNMADGNKAVVGLGTKPNRGYAMELAEKGFVTIAPPYPIMAGYEPNLKSLGYQSGTMKAIWDNKRVLDVLDSLPFVRHGNYAAIGHSLGGHNSIYTAVFDDRIKAIVSSCGFDSYLDYKNGDITGWTQERYMPALASYRQRLNEIPFDFHEMIAALAPRPIYVNAPTGDANFKWQSVDWILSTAKQIYSLYDATNKVTVDHPDCPHDFPPEIREKAYRFIHEYLK